MQYIVYALYNIKHKKIYIGQTQDISSRFELHKNKTFSRSYTARFDGEWVIIYQETVNNRQVALQRERQLKSYKGRQFIKKFIPQ